MNKKEKTIEGQLPSYYANIPATVRYDKNLCANAKLLYGEITALCNKEGYCWSTNTYFANLYNVSKITISRWVKQLREKKYIKVKMKYKRKTKEIEHRHIYLYDDPINKKGNTPTNKKGKGINTSSFNNTKNKDIKTLFPKIEETFSLLISEIIKYYFQYYQSQLQMEHPYLKEAALMKVAERINDNVNEHDLDDIDIWETLIQEYFEVFIKRNKNPDKDKVDFNISHFSSGGTIRVLKERV